MVSLVAGPDDRDAFRLAWSKMPAILSAILDDGDNDAIWQAMNAAYEAERRRQMKDLDDPMLQSALDLLEEQHVDYAHEVKVPAFDAGFIMGMAAAAYVLTNGGQQGGARTISARTPVQTSRNDGAR